MTSWLAVAPYGLPATTVTPKGRRSSGAIPISMNKGFAALICSVSRRTPTALETPLVDFTSWSWPLSRLENRMSETPFWATVKSDLPTASTSAAELSSPLLTTVSVTTVITAMPIANAMPIERDFFAHRFPRTKPDQRHVDRP